MPLTRRRAWRIQGGALLIALSLTAVLPLLYADDPNWVGGPALFLVSLVVFVPLQGFVLFCVWLGSSRRGWAVSLTLGASALLLQAAWFAFYAAGRF